MSYSMVYPPVVTVVPIVGAFRRAAYPSPMGARIFRGITTLLRGRVGEKERGPSANSTLPGSRTGSSRPQRRLYEGGFLHPVSIAGIIAGIAWWDRWAAEGKKAEPLPIP